MRKILFFAAAALCATACIYPYDPEVKEAPEGVLVVDGDVSVGDWSTVRLGVLYSLDASLSSVLPDLKEAETWVEDDAGKIYPGTVGDTGHTGYSPYLGTVFTIDTREASPERSYRLCVNALGAVYASDWSAPSAPPVIRDILFEGGEDMVTVGASVDGGDDGTGYLLLSYEETWEFHVDYYPVYEITYDSYEDRLTITEGMPDYSRYWCWRHENSGLVYPVDYTAMSSPGVTAYPIVRFSRTDSRNHRYYEIKVKAKTLTPSSYRFIKNLEDSSTGGDDLFTPNPGDLPSNIRCETDPARQVLGYVLTSRTVSKTATLDSRFLKQQPPATSRIQYLLERSYVDLWKAGWLPLFQNTNPNRDPMVEGPFGWGPRICYDCTAAGGTLNRPGTPVD